MKINIDLLKVITNHDLNISGFVNKLVKLGFETVFSGDVIDISIPYNRQDCNNIFSLLNEVSVDCTKNLVNFIRNRVNEFSLTKKININLQDDDFCPLYSYLFIEKLNKNNFLPKYIKYFLLINDVKAVNTVVDLINYVTLIVGQPLHGYDSSYIDKNIFIRKTNEDFLFNSINNEKIKIHTGTYCIYSKEKVISIPGIIGSYDSKILDDSKCIFIESAFFKCDYIKEMCLANGITTDSSKRFDNKVNHNLTIFALEFLSVLASDILNANIYKIDFLKKDKYLPKNRNIYVYKKKLFSLIGTSLSENCIVNILSKGTFKYKVFKKKVLFNIPDYRNDLKIEESIITNLIILYGYNNIKEIPFKINNFSFSCLDKKISLLKDLMKNNGFIEVINYSFVDFNLDKVFNFDLNYIKIKNPLSEKMNVMRNNLLQGILLSLSKNLSWQYNNIKLFEIGCIYRYSNNMEILYDNAIVLSFSEKEDDINNNFLFLKSLAEKVIFITYGNRNISFINYNYNFFYQKLNIQISLFEKEIGYFGLLNKEVLNIFDIKQNVYLFFLKFDEISNNPMNFYEEFSRYPGSLRDLSLIIDNNLSYKDIVNFIKDINILNLLNVNFLNCHFFDNDKNKSLTIRIKFQSFTSTLLDKNVDIAMDLIQQKLITFLKAEIRLK
jgi:phenylalanyl-tRNA synthetase beta chain